MEHTCKLCFRRFANGRAMGGHMRSHVTSATPPVKAQLLHDSSASSTSASSQQAPAVAPEEVEERGGDEDGKGMSFCYSLRENPRKSFRLVDPEFSSFAAVDAGSSSVVQDGESETESSRAPPSHGRRSKRPRPAPLPPPEHPEPGPASSVSDTTTEEDVALSLMMLSRDFWTKTKSEEEDDDEKQRSDGWEDDDGAAEEKGQIVAGRLQPPPPSPASARGRSKYQCGTCKKVFRSYQALGGHRASHKKSGVACITAVQAQIHDVESSEGNADREANKVHECSFCFRVFSSGQALGGHKRSHLTSSATATTITISSPAPPPPPPSSGITKFGESFSFIDLNLPAPLEDDAELSAVSDAEFISQLH
ncbi:zinc finger protein ZAT9-like [Elaeis guineensis]|uniref:Zinc finger protein ZAT9-like n=1 Tax=Elaeis guineensis var. tenera TaxID=51953 RepID=A0A6I9RWC9_ELAGV|nr:zinc finger protein ZAT9-like [Elaeis guineensis]